MDWPLNESSIYTLQINLNSTKQFCAMSNSHAGKL